MEDYKQLYLTNKLLENTLYYFREQVKEGVRRNYWIESEYNSPFSYNSWEQAVGSLKVLSSNGTELEKTLSKTKELSKEIVEIFDNGIDVAPKIGNELSFLIDPDFEFRLKEIGDVEPSSMFDEPGKVKIVEMWDIEIVTYARRIFNYLNNVNTNNQQSLDENDYILSTIEDYLYKFKEKMNDRDYKTLCTSLKRYFETGKFPKIGKKIQVTAVNVKAFGWALKELFKSQRRVKLPDEYLQFAKENISIFTDVTLKNLYKYFTTKP